MKALFGANLNKLFLIFYIIFQIQPILYFTNALKTRLQNAYNIWCKVLRGGNLDGVKEIQYYSSDLSESLDINILLGFLLRT